MSSPSANDTAAPALDPSKGPVLSLPKGADPHRWFAEEIYPHDGQLKAWLRRQYPSVRQEVDDVVQESYLKVWRTYATTPIRSAKSFLFTAARNLVMDTLRRRKVSPLDSASDFTAQSVMDERPDPAEALTYHEKVTLLGVALARLPDRCREIFVLRKFQGMPQAEVAEKFGVTERVVEAQVARGLKRLKAELQLAGIDGLYRDEK